MAARYFVAYTAVDGPGVELIDCAGLVYPGSLMGWAPTWNAQGTYLTQNSLFPLKTRAGGLGSAFVQRDAICGAAPRGTRRGIDHVLGGLRRGGWSSGASLNIVDLHERRMANLETHLDAHATYELPAAAGNYSHMNSACTLQRAHTPPRSLRARPRTSRVH